MLHKVVLILSLNESYWVELSSDAIYYAVKGRLTTMQHLDWSRALFTKHHGKMEIFNELFLERK